jgi:HAD superfamily hydrolase (TIGR01549 family)
VPLKAVFFDLDDTLFDHSYSSQCALEAVRAAYPALQAVPLEELEQHNGRLLDELQPAIIAGQMTLDEGRSERMRRLLALYGLTITPEEAARLAMRYRETYQATRRAVPGAPSLLRALHQRVKVLLITNNLRTEQEEKLRHCGLIGLIDEIVSWEETGFAKPDPRIFRAALRRVPCEAAEAVMIGDAWLTDIVGARRVGLSAIWLNRKGIACPNPSMASEIRAFEPLEAILSLLSLPSGPLTEA